MSVNIDYIVVSDKLNYNNNGSRYFIGYQEGEIIKPLCIILPQMIGYIKYFEYGGMSMSFLINNNEVWEKYKQIWGLITNNPGIKFRSSPDHDKKYLKTILGNDLPKENKHTCIVCITIESVIRIDKKNYPQANLKECKYKIKRKQMSRFLNAELCSYSDDDSDDN